MKNKKLFAILTLVCFMFTLMPVAAFAVPTTEPQFVEFNDDTESKTVEADAQGVEVRVDDSLAANGNGYYFFMMSGDDVVGRLPLTNTTGTSYTFADVTAYAGGSYDVYAVVADAQVTAVLNSGDRYADKVDALFEDHAALVLDAATLKVRGAETTYDIALTWTDTVGGANQTLANNDELDITADNGFGNTGIITAKVTKTGNIPVKDAKLTLSTNGFVTATAIDAQTDRTGEAKFKVAATRAGEYKVYVTYGDCTKVLTVNAGTVAATNVTVAKAPTAPVALTASATITSADVRLQFTDANGAVVTDAANVLSNNYSLALISKPVDSTLSAQNVGLSLSANPDNYGRFTLQSTSVFDEEGDYTFKVSLRNGQSATATVTVKEFDKTVGLQFVQTAPTKVVYDGNVTFAATDVVAVDANGVTKAATGATFSVSGKAVYSFDENTGVLTAKDEDYIGQKITVYAVYTEASTGQTFTASREVVVIDDAAEITYKAADLEVGVNNVLFANVFDGEGNKVTLVNATPQAIVLEKPENALVVASAGADATGLNHIKLDLLASVAGEYKIQTIVTYTEGNATKYLSTIDTFVVGATSGEFKDVVVVSIGADKIIVNSDVVAIPAPAVIKDSRTFVPLRAVAEAFGAVVDYDQATGAVTAELNGVKVVMMNGDKAYTVNGVAKVADVAPYLNVEASSTMVPVSFIAKAFGINYQCIYAEDGTVADVLFTK